MFIRALRLPNGRPPRLDWWGHHPFTARAPDLRKRPQSPGSADLSDIDTLRRWLRAKFGRNVPLYLAESTLRRTSEDREFDSLRLSRAPGPLAGRPLIARARGTRARSRGWALTMSPNGPAAGPGMRRTWACSMVRGPKPSDEVSSAADRRAGDEQHHQHRRAQDEDREDRADGPTKSDAPAASDATRAARCRFPASGGARLPTCPRHCRPRRRASRPCRRRRRRRWA